MHESLLIALRGLRSTFCLHWERRLRKLPPSSGLATPDALVHLMPATTESLLTELTSPSRSRAKPTACPCGLNPMLAYFVAAEDALLEVLFLNKTVWPSLDPRERESALKDMRAALQRVASREIDGFCSLCTKRGRHEPSTSANCRHPHPASMPHHV